MSVSMYVLTNTLFLATILLTMTIMTTWTAAVKSDKQLVDRILKYYSMTRPPDRATAPAVIPGAVVSNKPIITTPSIQLIKMKLIKDMVTDIGVYLAGHKFLDLDRRFYYKKEATFMKHFPIPRLKTLNPQLDKACNKGFIHCLEEIHRKIENTPVYKLQREDTRKGGLSAEVKEESIRISKTNAKALYMPFQTALEQFQFRTTASYFMCWFTMQETKELRYFGKECNQISWAFQYHHLRLYDYRADDKEQFGCAVLSFCPDPCTGKMHRGQAAKLSDLIHSPANPCKGVGSGVCKFDFKKNSNFLVLTKNFINYTCDCEKHRKGFDWSMHFHFCIDNDECYKNDYWCPKQQVCRNTVGGYMCVCGRGYLYNETTKACTREMKEAHEENVIKKLKARVKGHVETLKKFFTGDTNHHQVSLKLTTFMVILTYSLTDIKK